jgi:hypothetical protein
MADSSLDTSLPSRERAPRRDTPPEHPYRPEPTWALAEPPRRPGTQPARPFELLVALGLVAVADFAFVRPNGLGLGGFGFAVFFLLVPALVVMAARKKRLSFRLVVLATMLIAIAARSAYAASAPATLFGLCAVFALTTFLRTRQAFLTDVMHSFAETLVTFPQRFMAAGEGVRRSLARAGRDGRTPSTLFAQVAVPVALVSLFAALFGLANPVVGHWISKLRASIELPAPLRVLVWVGLLLGAVLLLRPAFARNRESESATPSAEPLEASRDEALREAGKVAVTRNALVALNMLFAGYHALDVACLWSGSPPAGMSEREYAHQGTFWLTIALLAMTAVVGIMFRGRLAYATDGRLSRGLAYAWLAQGLVLALGTYRRIAIHVATSGLSNLRILGILGTTLVVVGSIAVGVKLARKRTFFWLLRRQLDAVAIGLCLYVVAPTHLVSARVNVRRVLEHEYRALVHAEEEVRETESATTLLPLLHHDDDRIRRGIAALLLHERDILRTEHAGHKGFRDLDFVSSRSLAELEAASPELEATLGDVERFDAIVPFEYIRNSAIEGEIAQSEIAKVKPAKTRAAKAALEWLDRQDGFVETSATDPEVKLEERPSKDPQRCQVVVFAHTKAGRQPVAIHLELRRELHYAFWLVDRARVDLVQTK